MCNGRCPNSTANRPARHTVARSTVALVALTEQRAANYTESRIKAVQIDLNHDQKREHDRKTREVNITCVERIAIVIMGVILELILAGLGFDPTLTAFVRASPELLREGIERVRRL